MPRNATNIFGIPVDLMDMSQVVEAIFVMIEEYHSCPQPKYVATLNVDFLNNAHSWSSRAHPRNPILLQSLREAHLTTADGMPIVWMSRLLGHAIPERVTGADLVPLLARKAGDKEKSLFFLGGQEVIATEAVQRLKRQYPRLKIAGIACPWIEDIESNPSKVTPQDAEIVEVINAANPDILLISFGNPKQELWFRRVRKILQVPVTLGIGGTLAFITGAIPRAPKLMQMLGLEWLYRLKQEPSRLWKRYVSGGLKFLVMATPLLAYHSISALRVRSKVRDAIKMSDHNHLPVIELPSILDKTNSHFLIHSILKALNDSNTVILNFKNVIYLDAASIACLIELSQKAHSIGKKISEVALMPWTRKLLRAHRASDIFAH